MIKLLNRDCLEVLKALPDNSVDLVVTDPPYEIGTVGGGFVGKKKYFNELESIKDGFDSVILDELCRVMKNINCYFFCSQKQIIPLLDYFVKDKKCNWNLLTYHKTNPPPACGNKYLTDTEFILFFREKGVKIGGEYASKKTYYVEPLNKKDKDLYNHPTVKPLHIVENLILNSSEKGDIVIDPFMGSGTTGVASKKLGRKFIGCELVEEYFNTAKDRIDNTTIETS